MIDPDDIAVFCGVVFGGLDGYCAVRMFAEKGTPDKAPKFWWLPIDAQLDANLTRAAEWAAAERMACYVIPAAVTENGASSGDVIAFHSVVADIDTPPIEAKRASVIQHLGPPALEVASGGFTEGGEEKRHMYWRLPEPAAPERVCDLRQLLAEKIGADPQFGHGRAHQPIRVPGSVHGKNSIQRTVRIIR